MEKKIESLKNTTKSNFEQLNTASPPTEEMLKKQDALEKLFNEIFSAQKKRIYQAFSASKANEVVSFDNVLKKIINGKI